MIYVPTTCGGVLALCPTFCPSYAFCHAHRLRLPSSDCVLPVSSGIRHLLPCLPAPVFVFALVFLSTQSPLTANPLPHRHSPFTPSSISPSHYPCIHDIGLCFFARPMALFSRLRRVPLRTHIYTHYPPGLIVLCLFSFSFFLFFFNFAQMELTTRT